MSINLRLKEAARAFAAAIEREKHRAPEDVILDHMAKAVVECCGMRKQLGKDMSSIEKKGA